MNHSDHVALLRPANLAPGGIWADLGAGAGAFTLALRELVGPAAVIYAVDKDATRLRELEQAYAGRFGDTANLHALRGDFARTSDMPGERHLPRSRGATTGDFGFTGSRNQSSAITLPALDGVVMANSLHYFKDKENVLRHVRGYLKPGGALLLVEYNVDSGNMWVPHPLSFETWRALAPRAGFTEPRLLATHPSNFLREFYAAGCEKGRQFWIAD